MNSWKLSLCLPIYSYSIPQLKDNKARQEKREMKGEITMDNNIDNRFLL